ncbi:MAG: hypothetical protein AAF351_11345 [Pseudomonadota bacterium]
MLTVVLALNTVWFGLAFHLFWMRGRIFAKIVVPREHRDTPVLETLILSGRFLGGFNLAFAALNAMLLFNQSLYPENDQWSLLLAGCAIAHGTQFLINVPVAIRNRSGGGVWQVKGLMLFIFVTDFSMMALNGGLAAHYFITP